VFWNPKQLARRELFTDRSASPVACVRQWSACWTAATSGTWRAETSLCCPGRVSVLPICSWPLGELKIQHTKCVSAKPNSRRSLLRSEEDWWHHLEVWYSLNPTQLDYQRSSTTVSFSLPADPIFSRRTSELSVCVPSPRKRSKTRISLECDPVCNLHQRFGERSWVTCYYNAVCGQRRHTTFLGALSPLTAGLRALSTACLIRFGRIVLRYSPRKTKCLRFTHMRCLHPNPCLCLRIFVLPFLLTLKYLGVILDRKLSCEPYLRYVPVKCERSPNIMNALSAGWWGVEWTVMHRT
jgi:hypothetical protein